MSETAAAEEPGPDDAEEAFRRRQLDAVFTIAGPAPDWARAWPGKDKS